MKKIASLSAVVLAVLGNVACGSSDSSDAAGANDGAGAGAAGLPLPGAIDAYTWAEPPPADDVKSNPKSIELTAKEADQDESVFSCTAFDHDAHGVYDSVTWLSEQSGPLKPGLVLQGNAFKKGELATVPVKRTPIAISVDLAVPTPSRTIASPDSASIQAAIADLQSQADALADVPGNIQYTMQEVTTKEQIALSLGVHASYSGLLASAKLDSDMSHESGLTEHTVVASLVQPMYTVSFADEALPTAASFFDPSLTDADWDAQAKAGTISADNPPVFISSVTYGRMVMVSLTSTQGETADALKTLIQGSTAAFSASASVDASQKKEWSTLKHQELQRGGSAIAAAEAMQTGDLSKFFGKAAPSTMVPIAFTVKTLSGARKIARIGDLTHFTANDCQTTGAWSPVKTSADGTFSAIGVGIADDVWALNTAHPRTLYHFDKNAEAPSFTTLDVPLNPFHPANIRGLSVGRDGTVGMVMTDSSALLYKPGAGTFTTIEQGSLNTDAGNGDRQLNHLAVFDANTMAATNHEDIDWTGNGWTNLNWMNADATDLVGIDQFDKIWMTESWGGIFLMDPIAGTATNIGGLGHVDALTVGAPNDVWITYQGGTYHYDPKNPQTPWKPMNMGTVMPTIGVGVDGHLWGISSDGRINRWLGLRP